MQNHCIRPHDLDTSSILPSWTKQNELGIAAVDVHGDGTATGTSYDNVGQLLVEFGLGECQSGVEVTVIKDWIGDLVAVIIEIGQLDSPRNRVPTVEEEDFHQLNFEKGIK